MEPDTSMRQNITACATGFGTDFEAPVAHVHGVDKGDGARAQALPLQLGAEAQDLVLVRAGLFQLLQAAFQGGDLVRLRPPKRDAPRKAIPHRARDRELGRRAG